MNNFAIIIGALGKTSRKMSKIVKEICDQVRKKVKENQGTFLVVFGGNPGYEPFHCVHSMSIVNMI